MKQHVLLLFVVVVFNFPGFSKVIDSIPRTDFTNFSKISILDFETKGGVKFSKIAELKTLQIPAIIRPTYSPDIRQLRSNLSQDNYLFKIEARNNEWRNLFSGMLTTFVK
jgi:hypothetical protein